MLTRRNFLKMGIMGSVLLPLSTKALLAPPYLFLTEKERFLLTKLCPALLGEAWEPSVSLPLLLLQIDKLGTCLTETTQKELKRLFALLNFAPFRWGALRIPSWPSADTQKISSVLTQLHTHKLRFFRMIYSALQQLTFGAYYSLTPTWKKIGYEGPPDVGRVRGA